MRIISVLVILACLAAAPATQPADIPAYLQEVSVTIHAAGAQGSGVIVTRGDTSFVLTAGHVVDTLRSTRQVIDNGSPKTVVEFADAKIVRELIEDGRSVGRVEMDAEVLRYSDSEHGEDLALLRVRKKRFVNSSAVFWLETDIPPLMTKLIHCGSLRGQFGSNSLTTGIISQHGRVLGGVVYDQVTSTAFPGSSGGGVFTEDGRLVGMVLRGAGETFVLTVPIRRLRDWAKRTGVEFVIDPCIPLPDEAALKSHPVEDTGLARGSRKDTVHEKTKFMLAWQGMDY